MAASPSLFEFAVLSRHPNEGIRFAGPGLGASWQDDEERVRAHFDYLTGEWRDDRQREAAANEASGFDGGNEAWWLWNNERSGKKFLRFAIAKRPKPEPWSIMTAEDGFQVAE